MFKISTFYLKLKNAQNYLRVFLNRFFFSLSLFSAKSNTQVATVASNVLEIKKIEEDPAKLAEFQEKLYIEV